MGHYLMTIELACGEWQEYLTLTIEAQDRQMVKYHFHRTLKDWGFKDCSFGGKHCLELWDMGVAKELYEIKEIDRLEWEILDEHIYSFHKTAEH